MNIRSLRLFFPDWTKGFFLTKNASEPYTGSEALF